VFNNLFGYFSQDIGIDLGTANTLVYVRGRGIVINEASVVAVNQKTGQIVAIGAEAKRMVGRTPAHITATRPLVAGVVSDFEVTEEMLRYFIRKVHETRFSLFARPRVVIGIPSGITEVEKRAVEDAAKNAGAREVYLVEEPMAAAVGVRLPDHLVAKKLLELTGPLAVTSANRSGGPSSLTAAAVLAQLNGRIDLVIDGGPAPGGVPSTVVDCTGAQPVILREGPISAADIERAVS